MLGHRKGEMRMKQAIRSIDAFPRAEDHLLQKTQSGALGNPTLSLYFFFLDFNFMAAN